MRVIQLIDSLHVGGAENTAVNFANLLVEHIDKSYLCVSRSEGGLSSNVSSEVDYLFLNKKSVFDIRAILRLSKYIGINKISHIHAHSTSYFLAVLVKLLNNNVFIIWHDHNGKRTTSSTWRNRVLKYCSFLFSGIIVVSADLEFWAKNNLRNKNVYYLPNFSILKNERQDTILHGEKSKKIVCLANLRSPKNHMFLLEVFYEMHKKAEGWTLHLIGEDFKDDYSKALKVFIERNNLSENVFLYGLKKDIGFILSQCDIAVLSSKSEGLPLALIEYGLAKLPVVATNVGDCKKVVFSKNEGVLVEVGQTEHFTKALLNYMNNKTLRKQAGENLFDSVSKSFSAKSAINQLIEIYKS